MSFDLTNLSNVDLEALHKSLHADVSDSVKVQAHHLVTTELLVRGLDHGHNGDEWNRAVIEIGVENNVAVSKAFDGIPSDVIDTVNVELGYPESVSKSTILTVDGYTLKFDAVAKDAPMNMNDPEPEDALNETQSAIYEFLESLTETVGKFNKGCGANGAHYMEDNPFVDEGLMCANCIFYEGGGGCEIVEGQIDHMALCKFWVIPEDLLNGMSKHLQGQHDQRSHGLWSHTTSSVSESDFKKIGSFMNKRTIRLNYNEGYDAGAELIRTNPDAQKLPEVLARHNALHTTLTEFKTSTDELFNLHVSEAIVNDAGFFDGLNGNKRQFRRLLVDPLPWVNGIPLMKHLAGQHDQSSHGAWAKGNLSTHDWGYGSNRPEVLSKPQSIEVGGETITASTSGLWHYLMDDGHGGYKLTPERQELHDKLIAEALQGVPKSSDPTFTMMGGGGGSGKGTIQKKTATLEQAKSSGVSLPAEGMAVKIDADEIKAKLPDFKVFLDAGRKADVAGWTHEESSILGKSIQAAAIASGKDVFLDGTGNSSASSLNKKILQARNAGYKVNGCYVSASIDLAWKQNMQRSVDDPNRGLVPAPNFLNNHKSVSAIIPQMATQFDNFVLFDTNHNTRPEGAPAELIATASRGGTIRIVNNDLWKTFVNKASDKTSVEDLDSRYAEFLKQNGGK